MGNWGAEGMDCLSMEGIDVVDVEREVGMERLSIETIAVIDGEKGS